MPRKLAWQPTTWKRWTLSTRSAPAAFSWWRELVNPSTAYMLTLALECALSLVLPSEVQKNPVPGMEGERKGRHWDEGWGQTEAAF